MRREARHWLWLFCWFGTVALGMGGCMTLFELEKRHDLATTRHLLLAQQEYEAATLAMTEAREGWQTDLAVVKQDLGAARSALNTALNEITETRQAVVDGWSPEQRQRVEWERRLKAVERRTP